MESSERPKDTFDFPELWRTLQRRRRIVWGVTGLLFLLTVVYCLIATRKYKSIGIIEVRQTASDSLGLDAALGITDAASQDSLLTNIEIQTQSSILGSDALALRVIDELQLEGSPDFHPRFDPLGPIFRLLEPAGRSDPANMPLIDRPIRRESILKTFKKNLKVEPTPGTRLIEISYLSKNPQTAQAVVKQLILDLINSSTQVQLTTNTDSSKFMEDQLAAIRAQTERLQNQVAKMQQQAGIVSLGTTDTSGKEQAYSAILDELEQIGATLGQAQTNRILKGAVYDEVTRTDPELISGLSGNLTSAASPSISTSLNLIGNLRIQEAAEKANLAQMEAKFGSAYPKLEEPRTRIAKFEQAIHDEAGRVRDRAKNDYEIAVKTEQDARTAYNKLKSQADFVNNSAIGYAIAKEEAESSRKLYEDILSRSKEAEILQGLKPSDIAIIGPPMLPGKPASPKVLLFLAASLLVGLSLGVGIAILRDLLDGRIVSVAAVQADFSRIPLSVLPRLNARELEEINGGGESGLNLAVYRLPQSSYAEALRSLAHSLYLTKHLAPPQVTMITSSGDGEGKTTLSANLAVLLAQQGKRALLIDSDLRDPSVHTAMSMGNSSGLTTLLTSAATDPLAEVRPVAAQPGLFVLTAGSAPLVPSEAFSLPRLEHFLNEFRRHFDCIIVDSAPVLAVNDSIPLAGKADNVLLVSRFGKTRSQALRDSVTKLRQYLPAENLKLVINDVSGPGNPAIYHADLR